jgi:hypothetical protein
VIRVEVAFAGALRDTFQVHLGALGERHRDRVVVERSGGDVHHQVVVGVVLDDEDLRTAGISEIQRDQRRVDLVFVGGRFIDGDFDLVGGHGGLSLVSE